jgi:phenylalanyl-tRNA synthetase beta chain
MLASYKWLNDYVEIDISPKELADKMTMSGTKVEKIEELGKEISKVVVGKILEINQHPNADRLVVTKVDVGSEIIQIVTGAKNISEGDYIPVALVGSTLPGGVNIGKSKLRGIESHGMMCSAQELSLDIESLPHEQVVGIYILKEKYPLGMDVKEIFGLDEVVIEFELTYNRPDCLSIIGLAREVSATLNKPLILPEIIIDKEVDNIKDFTKIDVLEPEYCTRFIAKIIKDVKIGQSPKWMQERLAKVGVRSINNIVDVTNYVMMEMGQPLHAYDYNKLAENRIIVRKAYEGEKLVTLDDVERTLDSSMLVIADAKNPLGIAGVMGGGNSEVDENTNIILLEAANFDSNSVRQTAKKLGLRTEASSRYEKGVDLNLQELAMKRAAQLLEEINAGTIVENHIDIYNKPLESQYITIDPKWVNKFIGIDISAEQMADYLERLDMEVEIGDQFEIKVPTFRQDLKLPEDIAEEIARLYGYDKIPSTLMSGITVQGKRTYKQKLEDRVKDLMVAQGGNEICTNSFTSAQFLDRLNVSSDDDMKKTLMLINPLGEENSMMRTTLVDNMMQVINHNINHNIEEAFFFEIAKTYHPIELPIKNLPNEKNTLCVGIYGDVDFFNIKGIIENLLEECGISKYEFQKFNSSTFHPGRTAQVMVQDKVLGILGEIHPDVTENYDVSQRVYIGEFDFDLICKKGDLEKRYKELPKYPAVIRDIALQLKEGIPAREVEKIIEAQGSDIIESYSLFDVYQGEQIPKGYKSLAYSIVYRRQDGTLTDKEVGRVHNKIVKDLQYKLDANLRE